MRCARDDRNSVANPRRGASQGCELRAMSIDSGNPLFIALTDCSAARESNSFLRQSYELFSGVHSRNRRGEAS